MASRRPVDITVLHASNIRRPRAMGSQPVAVVTIEGHDDRFITGPGFGEDPMWKARQMFYIEEELVSGDEPSDIRVEIFDSPNLDCHIGTAIINLETAMDYYNKAHSYPIIMDGKPCGTLTVAVSVAPRSSSPSAGIPCSSTPPMPLVGPPLPGEPTMYAPMPLPYNQSQVSPQTAYARPPEGYPGAPRAPPPSQPNAFSDYPRPYTGQGGNGIAPGQVRPPPSGTPPPGMSTALRGYRPGPYTGQPGQLSPGPGLEAKAVQGSMPTQGSQLGHPGQSGLFSLQGKQAPYAGSQPPGQYAPQMYQQQSQPPQIGYPSQPQTGPFSSPGYPPAGPGGPASAGPYAPQLYRTPPPEAMGMDRHDRHSKGSRYDSGEGDMLGGFVAGALVGAATGLIVADIADDDDF